MKKIPLTQDRVALVDDEDFGYLNLFKWYAKESGSHCWYAVRKSRVNNRALRGSKVKKKDERKNIRMHNVIMKRGPADTVHHINGDGLDNRRCNLKICTVFENLQMSAEKTNNKQQQREELPF